MVDACSLRHDSRLHQLSSSAVARQDVKVVLPSRVAQSILDGLHAMLAASLKSYRCLV